MPQMAPLNWTMLFITFAGTFLIINSINYFTITYLPTKTSKFKISNKINWKW